MGKTFQTSLIKLLETNCHPLKAAYIMSIFSYNGGACVAMKGKDCVAIASDLRFGKELQTVTTDFSKCFEMAPHLWLGLTGLATDVQTVQQKMEFRKNMYELSESRTMTPKTFAAVLSNMLYERRFGPFFINPVIAGLDPATKAPYITSMDLIGNMTEPGDFAVAGTCEDEIFECIAQALTNALDRDASSGWGAVVHIIEVDKITTKKIKTRMD